jgi:hypothetical protein
MSLLMTVLACSQPSAAAWGQNNVSTAGDSVAVAGDTPAGVQGRPEWTPDDSLRASTRDGRLPPFAGYDPEVGNIRPWRLVTVGGVLGLTVAGIHIYQQNAWWSGQRGSFHIVPDPDYALNVDKFGHFYGGALSSWIGQKSMEWSGLSREAAVWYGFAIGAVFELYVEFEDGFAQNWGFSPGDATADMIGALWPVGQHYVPYMEHLQPKFSYWPSARYRAGLHQGNMIDDYEGQTYWMGVHVYGFMPRSAQRWWPPWLALAVGVAVRHMESYDTLEREIYLALDYDLTKIIPANTWFLQTLREGLNFIHLPSPAIRITPSYIAFGLYY